MRLTLTGNEPRQNWLFAELAVQADVSEIIDFDDIDPITRWAAIGLSLSWPKEAWWADYQMHPLMQRRRQRVLQQIMAADVHSSDAILMWGSLFRPLAAPGCKAVPVFHYIDQSHSLSQLPGERRAVLSRRRRAHSLQAKTYESAAGVLCMSEWARNQTLESHRVDEDKVVAVGWGPCGVDLSGELPLESDREPLVLHVSNDFYRKGVDFLIDTAEQVSKAVPSARFVVIGRDASRLQCRPSSAVEFLGPVYDKAVLRDFFRRASVFFLPHRFDRSPHVLAEAMSASLPIVTSRQGGPMEAVQHELNGLICNVGDVGAYSDAIIALLRDPGLCATFGAAGRRRMVEYYNWTSVASRILDRIGSTLGQQR